MIKSMIQRLQRRGVEGLDPKVEKARAEIEKAELLKWDGMFRFSMDFFHDLTKEEQTKAAIREAWRRLGHEFLATHHDDRRPRPWALQKFGRPGAL